MDFEPKGFNPEDIRPRDLPAACWHLATRVAPVSLLLLAAWWVVTAGALLLGQ